MTGCIAYCLFICLYVFVFPCLGPIALPNTKIVTHIEGRLLIRAENCALFMKGLILRATAGYTSHIKIFFKFLHTVCFMYGLSIYEIYRICHHARFFIILHESFQCFANFL